MEVHPEQVSDYLYELYKPEGLPEMEILFFHGLDIGDSSENYLQTWKSEDGSCIWPHKWLAEEFPRAHIFLVSYDGSVVKSSPGSFDMHILSENLVSDFIGANIGQTPNCPVILVGHSFGGLVIKQVCLRTSVELVLTRFENRRTKLEAFLDSVKGVFYYGTPHHGSPFLDKATSGRQNPFLKYVKPHSKDAIRLNAEFDQLCNVHPKWRTQGLGENLPTRLGLFQHGVVAPEGSTRVGDHFNIVVANHETISKPRDKRDMRFYSLKNFLRNIASDVQMMVPQHQCHGLPDFSIGLERRTQDIEELLEGETVVGIFGMGGVGKTTLAKEVFNKISKQYEYTCFVDNVKGIPIHGLEDWIVNHFHCKEMDTLMAQKGWHQLREKKILIVMDDVNSEDQLNVLPKLQHFGIGSRLILTSREKEIFKFFVHDGIYEVQFLDLNEATKLFCRHAFSLEGIPDYLTGRDLLRKNVQMVVQKCDGLPLTLEVVGRYLRGHGTDDEFWEGSLHKLEQAQAISGGANDRVWASLRISYDALSQEEKDMFVEAATIFFEIPLD